MTNCHTEVIFLSFSIQAYDHNLFCLYILTLNIQNVDFGVQVGPMRKNLSEKEGISITLTGPEFFYDFAKVNLAKGQIAGLFLIQPFVLHQTIQE